MSRLTVQNRVLNDGLDLLRIAAMFAVIWVHLSMYLPIPDDKRFIFSWGGYGVQVFFTLSGYLAAVSLHGNNDWKGYYKKRVVRILPPYYTIIIIAMIWNMFARDSIPDIFGLKWIRFFLGLNTILPSNDYEIWNNPYGWWTMSSFIWFYILAPVLMKHIKNIKWAAVFVPISLIAWVVWKVVISYLFGGVKDLDDVNMLSGASPFGMLIYFAFGILAFYAVKEKKELLTGFGLISFAIIGILINRDAWAYSAITGVIIILCNRYPITLKGKWKATVQFLGSHSFNVYLVHLLAFEMSWKFVCMFAKGNILYLFWGVFAVGILILLSCILNVVTKKFTLIKGIFKL